MKRIIFVVACVAIGIVGAAACGGATPKPADVPGTPEGSAAVPEAPSASAPATPEAPKAP
jgi:hypothetical protein